MVFACFHLYCINILLNYKKYPWSAKWSQNKCFSTLFCYLSPYLYTSITIPGIRPTHTLYWPGEFPASRFTAVDTVHCTANTRWVWKCSEQSVRRHFFYFCLIHIHSISFHYILLFPILFLFILFQSVTLQYVTFRFVLLHSIPVCFIPFSQFCCVLFPSVAFFPLYHTIMIIPVKSDSFHPITYKKANIGQVLAIIVNQTCIIFLGKNILFFL